MREEARCLDPDSKDVIPLGKVPSDVTPLGEAHATPQDRLAPPLQPKSNTIWPSNATTTSSPATAQTPPTPVALDSQNSPAAPDSSPARTRVTKRYLTELPPTISPWLKAVYFLLLILMCNQVKFPVLNANGTLAGILSKIGLSDLAFLMAFLMTLCVGLKKKLNVQLPLLCFLPILAMAVTNIFARTGLSGGLETVQMAMFLLGGVILFAFLHRYMSSVLLVSLTVALLVNLGVACYQDLSYGAFLTLAPKDVMELPYGFGQAVTGLFRSKIAFSLYLATSLAWCLPQWLSIDCRSIATKFLRDFLCLLLAVGTLFYITNPFLAILTAVALLIGGFASPCQTNDTVPVLAILFIAIFAAVCPNHSHVLAWKQGASILKGYDYSPDASVLFNRKTPVSAMQGYENAHELKSSHYDFIAALRLAADNPWYGVGSGNYQKNVGKAFALNEDKHRGQLPDPTLNDLETDSQAGWGILAATLGLCATAAFALLFCATLGANAKRHLEDMEDALAVHLGATLALSIFIIAMFYTNPLTRGLGWLVALAMASAETSAVTRKYAFIHPCNDHSFLRLICLLTLTALLIAAVPCVTKLMAENTAQENKAEIKTEIKAEGMQSLTSAPTVQNKTPTQPNQAPNPKTPKADAPESQNIHQTRETQTHQVNADDNTQAKPLKIAENEEDFPLVFNADSASQITMPMRRQTDPNEEFAKGILAIPDKAGVPPPGQKPALKHGGAVFTFQLKLETTAYLWCNVMWDGSCGNTLDLKVDQDKNSYTVGNDGTYNAWHWQRSPKSYKLKPGTHTITVLNREDGIKLAQVLLTQDRDYVPEGVEEE